MITLPDRKHPRNNIAPNVRVTLTERIRPSAHASPALRLRLLGGSRGWRVARGSARARGGSARPLPGVTFRAPRTQPRPSERVIGGGPGGRRKSTPRFRRATRLLQIIPGGGGVAGVGAANTEEEEGLDLKHLCSNDFFRMREAHVDLSYCAVNLQNDPGAYAVNMA